MTAFLILIMLGAVAYYHCDIIMRRRLILPRQHTVAYYYRDIIIPKLKAAWAKINRS